ncbi:hypothetical protein UFOVP655_22 [uncultured Caudovirales phage]|uniref:Uncharacterized protein n=1 Tax=uncultured Caudovirales phage TaxID=2100421 RepID=A0A6J5NDB4_9CAUD|nr:hypothetical protein UFOVP655_22 [uncultured Caudovirales phage]
MIKGIVKIENEWNKGEILVQEIEFESVGEIEKYLSYNRSYIRGIEFVGKIEEEN